MSNTFAQLYTHFIFSTKDRHPSITADLENSLYPYIAGICTNIKCHLIRGGGFQDHAHLLIRRHPSASESDIMQCVKANSSRWLREEKGQAAFAWQDGYGAFSVSASSVPNVVAYIARQREHHAVTDFKTEFVTFLTRHGIGYDPRYIFD